ncbi:hypothetical protein D3C86_1708360 [compost metagenome]
MQRKTPPGGVKFRRHRQHRRDTNSAADQQAVGRSVIQRKQIARLANLNLIAFTQGVGRQRSAL